MWTPSDKRDSVSVFCEADRDILVAEVGSHVTVAPDVVSLEHPSVFCLRWRRKRELLLVVPVPWLVRQDPPLWSRALLVPYKRSSSSLTAPPKMLSRYLPVRSSFLVAASFMFLSLASRPLFCGKNQARTGSGNRGGAPSSSSIRIVCVSVQRLILFFIPGAPSPQDHALAPSSERDRPIPAPPRSSTRASPSHDPPVGNCVAVVVPRHLGFFGVLVSA